MKYAVWELDGIICSALFFNWSPYYSMTFDPDIKIHGVVEFKAHGNTYRERKESVRDLAIYTFELMALAGDVSYGELATIQEWFEKTGKRYGLLQEFRENAII